MNGEELIEHFYWLTDDDTIEEERALILANEEYDALLASEFWGFLESSDSTQTIASGDSSYSLPDDFLFSHRITLRNGSTNSTVELNPVPFKNRLQFLGDSTKYYIDRKNSQVVFLGDISGYAGWLLIHDYQYQPDQIELATSPVFNRAFHAVIAYGMAKKYYYNDQGEKSRSWNSEMEYERVTLLNGLRSWDRLNFYAESPSADSYNYAPELN